MERNLEESVLYESRYRYAESRSNVRFFAVLLLIVAFFLSFRFYWTDNFGGVTVSGSSMYKTLTDKEQLVMKYTDGGEGAKRGDVIIVHVANYPDVIEYNRQARAQANAEGRVYEDLELLIKRLIAVEGDTVLCKGGVVSIKYAGESEFQELDEPYAHYRTAAEKANYDFGPYELKKGDIFFLGDNRTNSTDSRYLEGKSHLKNGLYQKKDIVGVVPRWAMENQRILEKIFFK